MRITELRMGARFALAGGRGARLRTGLIAAGVTLGVAVLLLAASIPHLLAARNDRAAAIQPRYAEHGGQLRLVATDTVFAGHEIDGITVQPAGAGTLRPPGVARLPKPGEMVVSPRLRSLLDGPGGAELRRRLHARVVGTIADAGLVAPDDARFVRGSGLLASRGFGAGVVGFGAPVGTQATPPIETLLVIVGLVALLLPVAAFVAAAGRFGAEERDRRLATLRLVGADIRATTTIATGEGLVGAIAGVGLGIALFLAARPLTQTISVAGVSAFSTDVRPSAPLAAAVVVLVPVAAVVAMVAGMRRVAVAPLGVSRRGQPSRRRLWWRLLTPLLGLIALAPMVGEANRLSGAGGQVEATLGVLLVLVGVSGLLPWLVEGLVRRAPGGSVSWLLAVRRLRAEEGTTGRVVGVIGLAVAGAIALQMVFAAAQAQSDREIPVSQRLTQSAVVHGAPSQRTRIATVLRAVPGVDHVAAVSARGGSVTVDVRVRAGVPTAPDRVRDAAASLDPLAQVYSAASPGVGHRLANLRRALTAGAFVVLLMIGASLLVAAAEQLRERRRVLAVLSAVGARRSTIARSVLWQSAIPIVCGLVLAVTLGTVLGTVLMHVGGVPVSYDWGVVALLAGAGAATIALVTVLTLPLVVSLMSADALRVE